MKKSVVALTSLALLFGFCAPVFAQPSSRAVETFIVDDFDNKGEKNAYQNMAGTELWTWGVQTSRFIEEGFPKKDFVPGQPNSLRVLNRDKNAEPKVLGIKTKFARKGENWFELYPEVDGKPYEIPFVGTCTQIDFWVWGANYNYNLEVLVRDADGRVITLKCGKLTFHGWRNVVINVPGYIKQHSRIRSGRTDMTFVGFRIRTDSNEAVDDYVIYFDQLKYTTNTLSNVYDGYALKDADFGDSENKSGSSSSSTSDAK